MSSSPHPPTRILKLYTEILTGFSHVYRPDGLNNTLFCQGSILEQLPLWEQCAEGVHPKDRGANAKPLIPGSTLWVNQRSCPLQDLLQHSSPSRPSSWRLQSHTHPTSTVCPELPARGFTSVEAARLVAIGLHWRQMPQQQQRHTREKTQIKIMTPKISNNFFHPEPHDPNH